MSAYVIDLAEIDGPGPEWYREIAAEFSGPPPRPRPRIVPSSASGKRRFWCETPAALAARLAAPSRPARKPGPPRRCRRCGYLLARCPCRGRS